THQPSEWPAIVLPSLPPAAAAAEPLPALSCPKWSQRGFSTTSSTWSEAGPLGSKGFSLHCWRLRVHRAEAPDVVPMTTLETGRQEGADRDPSVAPFASSAIAHLCYLNAVPLPLLICVHFIFFLFSSSRIEVAYQEAVALKRQEELIREEEAAGLAENELKLKRSAAEKEKRTKKKQSQFSLGIGYIAAVAAAFWSTLLAAIHCATAPFWYLYCHTVQNAISPCNYLLLLLPLPGALF
ncbi:hypothetical protein Taro_013481, partial [Colocasia esculenta]|nr:hypothetical protein [Colocasia esculenta]